MQVSYLANLFLSLCMAEAFSRVCGGGRHVAMSSPLLAGVGFVCGGGDVFSGARNGLIGVAAVCFHRFVDAVLRAVAHSPVANGWAVLPFAAVPWRPAMARS